MIDCAASAPIHAFQEFLKPILRTIFFPSHWLLTHITIVETTDGGVKGMNPVAMTIINSTKKYWLSRGLTQRPPVLKSARLPTEVWGLSTKLRTKYQNLSIDDNFKVAQMPKLTFNRLENISEKDAGK